MSSFYGAQANHPPSYGAQNLHFYSSSYTPAAAAPQQPGFASTGFGVSGRMGEQAGLRTGWLAAFSTEGYDGEPPLWEELGVNFAHIQKKTLAVLNPFRHIDQHLMDDSDLAGPILFFLLFGTVLLFSGKVHFGYIYGLALLGSTALHIVLSLMSPSNLQSFHSQYSDLPPQAPMDHGGHFYATLTFPRSASVLGYCLLPLVATSLFGVAMPMDTPLGIVLTSAAIVWCTYSASGMFCAVGRMKGMRALVAYPLALFYVGFGIIGIFSSRGSGTRQSRGQAEFLNWEEGGPFVGHPVQSGLSRMRLKKGETRKWISREASGLPKPGAAQTSRTTTLALGASLFGPLCLHALNGMR